MGFTLKTTRTRLPFLSHDIRSALEAVVEQHTERITLVAQENAPERSGDLRNSTSGEAQGLTGTVTVASEHAIFVEFGTEKQPSQPFLTPAVVDDSGDFAADIARAVQQATR